MITAAPDNPFTFRHVPHTPNSPALRAQGLEVRYGTHTALEDLSLEVRPGERLAVVGPNGAGKTTLFKAAAGLLEPSSGCLEIFGHPPRRHACIAYLVQRSTIDWSFPVTVRDVVTMGRVREIGLFRRAGEKDRAFVDQCLDLVGLAPLADRQIGELSGGQQQRMFIARALAQEAAVMLLDEPFTGLDHQTEHGLIDLLGQLGRRGVTILVATHDLDLAATHFDRVLLLNRRLIGCGPSGEVFRSDLLTATFGHHARTIRTRDGLVFVSDDCCSGEAHHG